MPHIHDKIDFTVNVFIVHNKKVLFIHHKTLGRWLPIGGHIELDEDPETALYREIQEECGLPIEIYGQKPNVTMPHGKMLIAPVYLDIHTISPTHQHIGMVYFATAQHPDVTLSPDEHHAIRWFTADDLESETYALLPNIKFYAHDALARLS